MVTAYVIGMWPEVSRKFAHRMLIFRPSVMSVHFYVPMVVALLPAQMLAMSSKEFVSDVISCVCICIKSANHGS